MRENYEEYEVRKDQTLTSTYEIKTHTTDYEEREYIAVYDLATIRITIHRADDYVELAVEGKNWRMYYDTHNDKLTIYLDDIDKIYHITENQAINAFLTDMKLILKESAIIHEKTWRRDESDP